MTVLTSLFASMSGSEVSQEVKRANLDLTMLAKNNDPED